MEVFIGTCAFDGEMTLISGVSGAQFSERLKYVHMYIYVW